MKKRFLTITEFAAAAGISRQTIYNNLDTRLSKYVKINDAGKKVISSDALSVFGVKDLTEFDADLMSNLDAKHQDDLTQLDTNFIVDVLRKQLEEKDKQIMFLYEEISSLRRQIEEKDKHIREQTNQILKLLESSQELQRNSQILLARQQEVKRLEEGKKKSFISRLFKKGKSE